MPSSSTGTTSEYRPNVDDDAVLHHIVNVVQINSGWAIARYQFDALSHFHLAIRVHVKNGVFLGDVPYPSRFTHNPWRSEIDPDRLLATVKHHSRFVPANDSGQHR